MSVETMSSIQDDIMNIMKRDGYRQYVVERFLLLYGERKTWELMKAFSKPPVPSIRVNQTLIHPGEVMHRMGEKRFKLEPVPWCDEGFWVYQDQGQPVARDLGRISTFNLSPGATHEYMQGYYSMQGSTSMIPAQLLDPQPGDEILDMTAAPGSKLVQIAQYMKNTGILVGVEKSRDRIKALKSNVQRCGVMNTALISDDARFLDKHFASFDRILLDAPCTGSGLMGADPTRKHSRTIADIETMMHIQIQLLQRGLKMLRPGGRLVYSTCSLAPEENENVVNEAITDSGYLSVVKPPERVSKWFDPGMSNAFGVDFDKSLKHALRMCPTHHSTRPEGFFCAIIEKA
ncbi:NOL1/NOP2/sun family putative RNA methylase [Candidatus Bathyarchaeota archaeon]|nr:NOL1/NOP2/sun family putative RNA methylase [Candidatus Bathyarchaeota archaeon]